jgi:hypothetical protein
MTDRSDGVVLLHGISRTSRSLRKMQGAIEAAGCLTSAMRAAAKNTKLEGMVDHIVIGAAHPWLPRNAVAIEQTIAFLRDARFQPSAVVARP